ncbi:Polyketide cyclase/dehydrase [Trema orientale]|uniref:Polyketide cyclase/dehydrase n=1 Tax=Trema orientale TaxID=63057 RepID=A0A2P5BF51_TREOI|nr:Polyketide cyclase/dehydrase [Trema orientale]
MEEERSQGKWEGKLSAELKGPTAKQVWPLLEDFCNLHKWLPTIDTCYQVDDHQGPTTGPRPGLIRYCAATTTSPSGESVVSWAKEKLIEIDPAQRSLSYEILDNNVGFKKWVATFQVVPIGGEGGACEIRWSFVGDPAEGWSYESLVSYYELALQSLAKKMEQALVASPV